MVTHSENNDVRLQSAAASDAVRIEAAKAAQAVAGIIDATKAIDLDKVGADEAKVLMSAEHKALGFRPPPDSLAAQAQAAAARHPDARLDVDPEVLREIARSDAAKITSERVSTSTGAQQAKAGIDLEKVGEGDARVLMSAEHKALGFRPPPGSIAAEAQAAAAKHPDKALGLEKEKLAEIARQDAQRIAKEREPAAPTLGANVDLSQVGAKEAAEIESAEHKALGYRPPKDSLAAAAKSAAAEHPTASAGLPKSQLAEAAREDALRVRDEHGPAIDVEVEVAPAVAGTPAIETVAATGGVGGVGLDSVGEKDARTIQSEEHKALGYRPPPGSLAAEAQSAAAKHPAASTGLPAEALRAVADVDALATELERAPGLENVGEDDARTIQSAEHKALGYRPPPGTLAAEAQSAAAKHPDAHMGLPKEELQEAAVVDAALTEAERALEGGNVDTSVDLDHISKEEARTIQSAEQQILGYRPPKGSLAAEAQSAVDKKEA